MTSRSFATSFSVDQSPEEVFNAITNVRGWWTGDIEGSTDEAGDAFTYRYQDIHCSTQKVTELIPGKKVVWRVLDANLKFAENRSEWTGTEITFEIARKDGQTEVHFTHLGLIPEFECFDTCSNGWGFFINESLRRLISAGEVSAPPPWA